MVRASVASLCRISKPRKPGGGEPRMFAGQDDAGGRALAFEAIEELLERGAGTFGFDDEAGTRVEDPTGEAEFGGEAIDKGPEADALHRAVERYAETDCRAALRC